MATPSVLQGETTALAGDADTVLFSAADNSLIKTIEVGVLPDQLTFTPHGDRLSSSAMKPKAGT